MKRKQIFVGPIENNKICYFLRNHIHISQCAFILIECLKWIFSVTNKVLPDKICMYAYIRILSQKNNKNDRFLSRMQNLI